MRRDHILIVVISVALSTVVSIALIAFGGSTLSNQKINLFGNSQFKNEQLVERRITELIEDETASIKVVENVMPAVVSVIISAESFYENGETVPVGGGTGFFVTEDGLIATNKHVVKGRSFGISIVTNDGEKFPVEIVAQDYFDDVAVLKIPDSARDDKKFPIVNFGDSDSIKIGQTVIAIGNTLSEFRNTVTKGVISGINRRVVAGDAFESEVIDEAIQTDAAINPGNSGGPLINLLGEVIAMNTATSSSAEGVGFALPINRVKKIVEDIKQFGKIVRPWLGVRYVLITKEMAKENSLSVDYGVLVVGGRLSTEEAVIDGSPAQKAGIKEGDIITKVNDKPVTEDDTLGKQISGFAPGDGINLTVFTNGIPRVVNVVLGELDPKLLNP